MLNRLFYTILLGLLVTTSFSQESRYQRKKQERIARRKELDKLMKKEEQGALIFDKQWTFGIKLNTDGYGLFYEKTKFKTITKANSWWIELGERRDKKEKRTSVEDWTAGQAVGGNSYIYGKVNNFYYTRFGVGQQRLLGSKGAKNGIAITGHYGAGISLALMKPYYLQLIDKPNRQIIDAKYGQNAIYDSMFLDPYAIWGSSPIGKGFGEISVVPGLNFKAALRFDWDKFNDIVSALEVGINTEIYTKKLNILAYSEPSNFYFNAYVALVFGSRKLK